MKKIMKFIVVLLLVIAISSTLINLYVIMTTKNKILNIDDKKLKDADCILILGAGIRRNKPSPMLEDRLLTGIELYENEISNKILVSGDHIESDYDEVGVMKNYLLEHGIPSEKIFVDHAGISSYDSVYRAKEIYKADKIVIVTQKYHLYRAIYIGNHLDLEVYGIAADKNIYQSQEKRDAREFLARIKDFFKCIIKPQSTYLGEVHSIKGNGINTHNK